MERLTEWIEGEDRAIPRVDLKRVGHEKCTTQLARYEDTGLTPPEIMKLKERDTAKAPNVSKDKYSDTYICPTCNYTLIHKDETGYFCGQKYIFCPKCGQRLKWEG